MGSSVLNRAEPAGWPLPGDAVAEADAGRAQSLRFLASFSDAIRIPVNGILGMTDLMLETNLASEQREYLLTTRACTQELLEKIEFAHDFSSLCLRGIQLESSPFDLMEMLETVVAEQARMAALRGIELIVKFEPDLPTIVEGPLRHVRHALACVIRHSVNHTWRGEIELSASALQTSGGILLQVQVRDTGSGYTRTNLERIRMFLAQGNLDCGPAYLPLLIADRIMRTLDGQMELLSEGGRGTTFSLTVSLGVVAESLDGQHAGWDPRLAGKRAAVLAPHPGVAMSARRLLEQFGLEVIDAEDQPGSRSQAWLILVDADHFDGIVPKLLDSAPHAHIATFGRVGERPSPGAHAHLSKPLRRYALYDLLLTFLAGSVA